MAEYEQLSIIIDVLDQFTEDLNRLIAQLAAVEASAEAVEDITIDVDVRGEQQLNALMTQLAAIEAMDLSGAGNVRAGARGAPTAAADPLQHLGGGRRGGVTRGITIPPDVLQGLLQGVEKRSGDVARSMSKAADAASDAADGFDITNLRMSDLHNAMARILPLLAVFIGALPAVIGAVAALAGAAISAAAALMALTGFGALGAAMARGNGDAMEGIREILNEIQSDFMDAFGGMAQRLAPLFERALDGLERFFNRVASLGDILVGLQDEGARFGAWFSDWLVGLIQTMGQMTEAFAPIFSQIGGFLEDMNLLRNLAGYLADVLPEMAVFTRLAIGMIVRLFEMSKGFLRVANVIGIVLSGIFRFLNAIGLTDERIGGLLGAILGLTGAYLLLTSSIVSGAITSLVRFGAMVVGTIGRVLGLSAANVIATAASWGLYKAIMAVVGALTLGVGAIVAAIGITKGLSSMFGGLAGNISSATESLKAFRREQNRMSGGRNPYKDPDLHMGAGAGRSPHSGSSVTVNVEGDADDETVRNQSRNAMYRMERTRRSR